MSEKKIWGKKGGIFGVLGFREWVEKMLSFVPLEREIVGYVLKDASFSSFTLCFHPLFPSKKEKTKITFFSFYYFPSLSRVFLLFIELILTN